MGAFRESTILTHAVGGPVQWVLFILLVIGLLVLDLGVFHKKLHIPTMKESLVWSLVWIGISLAFNVFVYYYFTPALALEFFTGYLIEKSLSVDNLFVFVLVFTAFKVPRELHYKILFWGILGAIVFRILFILLGTALLNTFSWAIYVLGAILVYSGYKIAFKEQEEMDLEKNRILKYARKILPLSSNIYHKTFFCVENGKWHVTTLFLTLIVVETTDIVFALDSIPAIFAVSKEPFIVFTSNIFAILGLRSLYFLLADMVDRFVYLNIGLGVILSFVGTKMIISHWYHIPTGISLAVIFSTLIISIGASLSVTKPEKKIP